MFTGIVTALGTVERVEPTTSPPPSAAGDRGGGSVRIAIATSLPLEDAALGASIAVDGVCLTIVAHSGASFEADLGPETLAVTTLGQLAPGARVHLERPLRMGDELGGHLVAGHVDARGTVARATALGDALELVVRAPARIGRHLVPKGSITVDGVSLTVNHVRDRPDGEAEFSVTLIPHTLAVTKLGDLRPGDPVNLEADLLAKHVAALVEPVVERAVAQALNRQRTAEAQ